jgi:hypothetical protein
MEGYNLIGSNLCDLSYEDAKTYERSITRRFPLELQRSGVYQSIIGALSQRKLPKKLAIGFERRSRKETLLFLVDLAEKEMAIRKKSILTRGCEPSNIKCPLARKNITVYTYGEE